MVMSAKRQGERPGWPSRGKHMAKSSSRKSVPRVSRRSREGWPLGKAARATRAVSSGTGSRACERNDMRDVLLRGGWGHDSGRGPLDAIARVLGADRVGDIHWLRQKIFSVVSYTKKGER